MTRTTVVHQRRSDYDIDIGRSKKNGNLKHMNNTPVGEPGWIGNPYCLKRHGGNYTLDESIKLFRRDFHERLDSDEEFKQAVLNLEGKALGCYCKPDHECHGDVIAAYLNDSSSGPALDW